MFKNVIYVYPLYDTYVGYKFISRGYEVAAVQFHLTKYRLEPGPIDEIFGSKTHSALLKYQSLKKLQCDGIAGPQFWLTVGP
ncbi:MAG: peptidoglycan-binding domain-containing protein [Clostridium sp.]|uniref:peptidoglycan-binding domain-containing protein n=1 Tax=Clostridium sp. TaxID=1506 RepID=UPI002FC588F5